MNDGSSADRTAREVAPPNGETVSAEEKNKEMPKAGDVAQKRIPQIRNVTPPKLPTQKGKQREIPVWWRSSPAPFFALVLSCYAMDCLSRYNGNSVGTGAALGLWLLAMAVLVLRRDLSGRRVLLITVGSLINVAALVVSGSWVSILLGVSLMFFCLYMPFAPSEVTDDYRKKEGVSYCHWWNYWFIKSFHTQFRKWTKIVAWIASIAFGVMAFAVFLNIFAEGNPLVEIVRDTIEEFAGRWLFWVRIDGEIFSQMFAWFFGALMFGFLLLSHSPRHSLKEQEPVGKPLLPAFPFVLLLFINLAFLIANSTDIVFLWQGVVPEGISRTDYLYEGAQSVAWASVWAGGILVVLFRARGSVRGSVMGKMAAYLLVFQTFLLSVSVAIRLYNQIERFGFTPFRIEGAWCLLCGGVLLVLLLFYMTGRGGFRRFAVYSVIAVLFVLSAAMIRPVDALSGDLNLLTMDDHPNWEFSLSDLTKCGADTNIPFAIAVHERLLKKDPQEAKKLGEGYSSELPRYSECYCSERVRGNWRNFNFRDYYRGFYVREAHKYFEAWYPKAKE